MSQSMQPGTLQCGRYEQIQGSNCIAGPERSRRCNVVHVPRLGKAGDKSSTEREVAFRSASNGPLRRSLAWLEVSHSFRSSSFVHPTAPQS